MPGPICKTIIDAGRTRAAAAYYTALVTSSEDMLRDGFARGVLDPFDPRVAAINEKVCDWSEALERWNAELFKLASELAASAPATTRK